MPNLKELEAQLADAQREAKKKRIAELTDQVEQADFKAGEAREQVESEKAQFRTQEATVQRLRKAYQDSQSAFFALDAKWHEKRFHTQRETQTYTTDRDRLKAELERHRLAYIAEKDKLDPLRLHVVKADAEYVRLASISQALANQLDFELDDAPADSMGLKGGLYAVS